ncbi:MAG: tetratricopeptide repeat protein [Chitinophagales bacterium]|nr:tetratricopeptide repeat protein [Chitinophagales bacterium]
MTDYQSIQNKMHLLEEDLNLALEPQDRIRILNSLSRELYVYSLDRAQSMAKEAWRLAIEIKDQEGIAASLNSEALCCRIRSDFKKSLQLSQEAFKIYEKEGNKKGLAESLSNIAFMQLNIEEIDEALPNAHKSISLSQEVGDIKSETFANLVMGMVYECIGNYPKALEHHLKTLSLARSINDGSNEGAALLNLGIIFRKIGEIKRAMQHFEDSYKIFQALRIKLLEAASLYHLGTVYRDLGEYSKALQHLRLSLQYQKELNHVQGQGACLMNIGTVYQKLKKFQEAEECIRQSIELARVFGRKNYECNGLCCLGECFMEQKRDREAIHLLEEARAEAEQYALKETLYKIQLALARAYERRNDFKKSLIYFKSSTALREELVNEESSRKNKGLMLLHEVETAKRDKEIAIKDKERAEQSEKFKEQFLANMSHEIRTPMNAIVGLINLLSKTKLEALQLKYVDAIRQSADNLLSIIQDILDFSKIESGQTELEEINFSIRDSVEMVYNTMRYKAEEKNLQFSVTCDENLPAEVAGDTVRLKQILINLTGNAIKFTDNGFVKIECTIQEENEEFCAVHFAVTDSGIGIPEQKMDDVFKSFVQASASTTRKYGGTGLGLSISKHLVEMQGGTIGVTSKVNEGTQFSFTIPYKKLAAEEFSYVPINSIVSESSFSLDGLKVLLVEDNKFNQLVAVDTLESQIPHVKVEVAENGKIALEKLKAMPFDVILLDLQMPEMDGYEMAELVRNQFDSPLKDIPIIALTANATRTEQDKCIEKSIDGYISKPFRSSDLMEQLQSVLTG